MLVKTEPGIELSDERERKSGLAWMCCGMNSKVVANPPAIDIGVDGHIVPGGVRREQSCDTLRCGLRGVADVRAELGAITAELYDTLATNRRGIKLDRSARGLPQLAALWFEGARASSPTRADFVATGVQRVQIETRWRRGGPLRP